MSFMLICSVFATRAGLFKQRTLPVRNTTERVGLTLGLSCQDSLFSDLKTDKDYA